ncbi:PAS domain-containing protein [Streptomyces sp. SD11]|uniref:PAS domain-containing protein n=1 Tax=Streptomyces sp. SD11 TaxID=3452209 RepID=UPI003F8BD1F8
MNGSGAPGGRQGPGGESYIDFAEVFQSLPSPVLLLTPGLVMLDANRAYVKVSGRGLDELRGRSVFDVFPDSPADRREGARTLRASLERVLATGERDTMALRKYDVEVPGGPGGNAPPTRCAWCDGRRRCRAHRRRPHRPSTQPPGSGFRAWDPSSGRGGTRECTAGGSTRDMWSEARSRGKRREEALARRSRSPRPGTRDQGLVHPGAGGAREAVDHGFVIGGPGPGHGVQVSLAQHSVPSVGESGGPAQPCDRRTSPVGPGRPRPHTTGPRPARACPRTPADVCGRPRDMTGHHRSARRPRLPRRLLL